MCEGQKEEHEYWEYIYIYVASFERAIGVIFFLYKDTGENVNGCVLYNTVERRFFFSFNLCEGRTCELWEYIPPITNEWRAIEVKKRIPERM